MPPSSQSKLIIGALLALATSIVVSLATAATKYTVTYVSIEQIVAAQYIFCTIIMLPAVLKQGGINNLKTKRPWLHLIRGASGWLCFYSYYLALDKIPLVDASLLRNAAPLCVPVLLFLWKGFRMPLVRWIPVFIGFVGIALVLSPQGMSLSFWHLAAFCSAVTLAGSIVTTRALTLTEPTNRILFFYFLFSSFCSIPLALATWSSIPLVAFPFMIGIGLSIWLTMWLYTKAYSYAKATVISPISYCGVLFTGLLGWLIWNQIPQTSAIVGAVLIIVGGIWSVQMGSKTSE